MIDLEVKVLRLEQKLEDAEVRLNYLEENLKILLGLNKDLRDQNAFTKEVLKSKFPEMFL